MPLDQAILAARDREAPPPHRLHLAVAHAGEVSAHYIGGRLKHPFLLCERLRIEAFAPWPTAIGINRDRRVHAAHFNAQAGGRSEEHTSELQYLMTNSDSVSCFKKPISQYTQHNR